MVFYFYLKISSWLGSQMIARFPSFGFLLYINLHSSLGLLPKGHLRSGLPGSNGVRVLKIDQYFYFPGLPRNLEAVSPNGE